MVHQEPYTVFFRGNRIGVGKLKSLDRRYQELVSPWSPLVSANRSCNSQRRFLGQLWIQAQGMLVSLTLNAGGLYRSGAVPDHQKGYTTTGAFVSEPPIDGHVLAVVLTYGRDGNGWHNEPTLNVTSAGVMDKQEGSRRKA
jgi:hypothetical protein